MTVTAPRQLDPDAAALVERMSITGEVALEARGVDGARGYLLAKARRVPGPAVERVHDASAAGVPVRIYRPRSVSALPVVTFFHGGGWVVGGLDESDAFCRLLATTTPCVVVSVGYRLAPEAPWPAAVDDAGAAVAWVAEHAADLAGAPTRHVVVGESAGGNVATVTVRHVAAQAGQVDRQVLAYPTIEANQDRVSHEAHGGSWPLRTSDLAWFVRLYVPDPCDRRHPDVAPIEACVGGMLRTTLLLAGCDPLRDEGLAYAEHLAAAGVAVDVHLFEGQVHGFLTFPEDVLPTSREAVAVVANVVRYA